MASSRTPMTPFTWWALLGMACSDFTLNDPDEDAPESVAVVETFLQDPTPRVDVLWLVDNTASMAAEQAYLAEEITIFADRLDAEEVSWQMGAVTPDGRGILEGNPWVITPDNLSLFSLNLMLQPGTDGALPATGLDAIMSALSEPRMSTDNIGFRRDDAALQVVIYSDGDDQSEMELGPDPVEPFLQFLDLESSRTGRSAVTSAIVGPTPSGCTGPAGTATAGDRYQEAALESGGIAMSICEPDLVALADQVTNIGTSLLTAFSLQAEPSTGSVRVSIDDQRIDSGWSISSRTLSFDAPPPYGSIISVRYRVGAR